MHVNIIHPSTPRSTKWPLTFSFPLTINILQTFLFSCSLFQNSADSPYLIPSATCLARSTLLNFNILTKPNFLIMQHTTLPSPFAILIKCQLKALCFRTLLVSIRKNSCPVQLSTSQPNPEDEGSRILPDQTASHYSKPSPSQPPYYKPHI